MTILAQTSQRTTADPAAIFALWADINNWADYDDGIEWAKLGDSFVKGGHYVIKPKGGPKTKADILEVVANERFVDVSHLFGAKLRFDHIISVKDSEVTVNITMTLAGPLSRLWARVLGKNQQSDLEKSTAKMLVKAES